MLPLKGASIEMNSLAFGVTAFVFQNIKNSAIIVQIPLLRETIAQLVYKVKGALAANKCSTAFWIGNLKNKNIYGEEILSQTTSITGSNLSADDDENNDGDCDEEEENDLLENSNGSGGSGVSRVRKSKRQSNRANKAAGKKRKLYRSKNDMYDDADDNDDNDSSRSRCF